MQWKVHIHLWKVVLAGGALLLLADPAGATDLQAWDTIEHGKRRFEVLLDFNNEAVRDNETQLVWERSPGGTDNDGDGVCRQCVGLIAQSSAGMTWNAARAHCINKNVGGRKGWRLASVPELASLIDPSVSPPGPTLPPGHPFNNVQTGGVTVPAAAYWSATSDADVPVLPGGPPGTLVPGTFAWAVSFFGGSVGSISKPGLQFAWCVRGGMNADRY